MGKEEEKKSSKELELQAKAPLLHLQWQESDVMARCVSQLRTETAGSSCKDFQL